MTIKILLYFLSCVVFYLLTIPTVWPHPALSRPLILSPLRARWWCWLAAGTRQTGSSCVCSPPSGDSWKRALSITPSNLPGAILKRTEVLARGWPPWVMCQIWTRSRAFRRGRHIESGTCFISIFFNLFFYLPKTVQSSCEYKWPCGAGDEMMCAVEKLCADFVVFVLFCL